MNGELGGRMGRQPSAAAPPFRGAPLAPEAPGPGGLGGGAPPRKAGGSGGREPPRKSVLPTCVGGRLLLAFPHLLKVDEAAPVTPSHQHS